MKRSKGYRKAAEKIDASALHTPLSAVRLAKETSPAKFDATVEVAMRLGIDPRKAELVHLKFFAGRAHEECATLLGVSLATVERQWAVTRAWLLTRLGDSGAGAVGVGGGGRGA